MSFLYFVEGVLLGYISLRALITKKEVPGTPDKIVQNSGKKVGSPRLCRKTTHPMKIISREGV
jgi:hypothetical protein